MSKPVVVTVFGTRPEAIKMAPVVLQLREDPELDHRLVVTAQHRRLLDDVLALFDLEPQRDLDLMQERQSLEYVFSGALNGVSAALHELQPDFVLVHGDTTTTFAATLAAFYQRIPVGHVEAGLRTSTLSRPFPEELNRRVTDLIAQQYYCPTAGAAANLHKSDIYGGRVFVTGNTALDAVRLVQDENYKFHDQRLADFAAQAGPKLLVTAHRRENWGEPLKAICRGLLAILADFREAHACFCWHPNPVVRESVGPLLDGHPRVLLVDPPRFDEFANLMARCDLLLTDSGGIQEEISLLKRFALVLRHETERPEAVEAGFAQLVLPEDDVLRRTVGEVLPRCLHGELPPTAPSPFGDGHAAERVHAAVRFELGLESQPPADYR